jgi:hypothetical protein
VSNRGLRVGASACAFVVLTIVGSACSSSGSGGSSAESTVPDGVVIDSTTSTTSTTPSSSVPTSTTVAPGYAALANLLPTDVPSGLVLQPDRLADTGATNLAKAIQDDVTTDAGQTLRDAGFVSGYQRAWADADGVRQNVLYLYQFKTAAGAAQYVTRRAAALEQESAQANGGGPASHFPVLISGAIGLRSESADSSFGAVVFSKGVYAVLAQSTDTGKVDESADASALAAAQNLRLP